MTVAAIIVAAGQGSRTGGGTPKQFRRLAGRLVVDWSLTAFESHDRFDAIALVVAEDRFKWAVEKYESDIVSVVRGDATRTGSVRRGLEALLLAADDLVFVHDGARPGLAHAVLDALLASLDSSRAAAPALPMVDTVKRRAEGRLETVDRTCLHRVQTPQAFHAGLISDALGRGDSDLFDDLQAVEALGVPVALVPGDEALAKITYPEDFERIARLMPLASTSPRIGKGFDVHAFGAGDHVMLCGVAIEHDRGLVGHSDADVGWHALTDAILGAAALGDIGDHFPPTDDRWKGASSDVFLKAAAELAEKAGWRIENCDMTIICEFPKVKPHRESMRTRTANVLGLDISAVSVKATTTEGLGFTGRGEGIAAEAVVLLSALG